MACRKICIGAKRAMLELSLFRNSLCLFRRMCTKQAVVPELDVKIKEDIENDRLKPRKHPGVRRIGTCALPDEIVNSIRIIAEDHPVSTIVSDAKMLANYLFCRHYPWEEEDLAQRKSVFKERVQEKIGLLAEGASEEQVRHYNNIVKSSVSQLMQKYNYRWSALDLHDYSSIVYLFTRGAANYSAAVHVLNEITTQCPEYKPSSLFDFGSGVGSVSWAVKRLWGNNVKQYFNIDSSSSMNNLAMLILRGGNPNTDLPLHTHYREFLPAQQTKHSIVVSAHSLMELPSQQTRLETLLNLWQKTEDFLIIIEQGTKPGFKIVAEARDFVLSLSNDKKPAHIFAPCQHDEACPRVLRGPYPCHYQTKYYDLDIGKKIEIKKDLLSYVIIKKGVREKGQEWPRVVRPILQRHNHVICRLCTSGGQLQEIIFTKNRHGKALYKCAKKTKWGDLLPVNLSEVVSLEAEAEEEEATR